MRQGIDIQQPDPYHVSSTTDTVLHLYNTKWTGPRDTTYAYLSKEETQ